MSPSVFVVVPKFRGVSRSCTVVLRISVGNRARNPSMNPRNRGSSGTTTMGFLSTILEVPAVVGLVIIRTRSQAPLFFLKIRPDLSRQTDILIFVCSMPLGVLLVARPRSEYETPRLPATELLSVVVPQPPPPCDLKTSGCSSACLPAYATLRTSRCFLIVVILPF